MGWHNDSNGDLEQFSIDYRPSVISRLKYKISSLKNKIKDTAAVLSGKRFANDKNYEGAPRVSQEEVETFAEKWVIKECIPACSILWDKNIYTFMCSDYANNNAWIELAIDTLSSENIAILEEIKKEYKTYQYHYGCINIEVNGMGRNAMEELIKIANRFVMQDVPKTEATISLEGLLIECGCSSIVRNPKYESFEKELEKMMSSGWGAPMEEEYIRVFDKSKIVKPVNEYIAEYGAVLDEDGTIYRSKFHYDKHLKYLKSLDVDNGDSGFKM